MTTNQSPAPEGTGPLSDSTPPEAPLGRIYCFCVPDPFTAAPAVIAYAVDIEGKTVASHTSSDEAFGFRDIHGYRERFRQRYPLGYHVFDLNAPPADWVNPHPAAPPSEPLPTEGERETCKQIYFPWDRGDTLIAVRQLRAFCAAQVQEATAAERERLLALLEARKCPFTHRSLDGGKTWPKYTLEEKLELLCFCVNDTDSHPDEPALRKALTELQQQLKERDTYAAQVSAGLPHVRGALRAYEVLLEADQDYHTKRGAYAQWKTCYDDCTRVLKEVESLSALTPASISDEIADLKRQVETLKSDVQVITEESECQGRMALSMAQAADNHKAHAATLQSQLASKDEEVKRLRHAVSLAFATFQQNPQLNVSFPVTVRILESALSSTDSTNPKKD